MRLLNRLAYGPRPGDVARVARMGVAAYVEEQLAPDALAEHSLLTWRLGTLADMLDPDTGLLFDEDDKRLVSPPCVSRLPCARSTAAANCRSAWSSSGRTTSTSMRSRARGRSSRCWTMGRRSAVTPLVSSGTLLGASAQSAAMLGYLDNTANRKGVPNENYARELMELHTLGVHGGYTQRDVKEVARCLTGWTVEKHWHRGRFRFDPAAHDDGIQARPGRHPPIRGRRRGR